MATLHAIRRLHERLRIHQTSTVALLKNLVRIPSVNPAIEGGQGEGAIADYVSDWFRKTGKFHVMEQKVSRGRYNVVVLLAGDGEANSLMLNGHMDTVGTSNMTRAPFRPIIEQGRIHGRGSCDMKGSIASMMSAMVSLANLRRRLDGDVLFTAVVDEEAGSLGTLALVRRFRADAAIVGEPTRMEIAVAHKGFAWFEIETVGKRVHGSVPEKGIDAIEEMTGFISELHRVREEHRIKKHPLVGTPRIHTSTITGGSDWSSVPAKCVLRLERRLIPGETALDALSELNALVARCKAQDRNFRANVRLVYNADSMETDTNAPHISTLRKHVKSAGRSGRIVGVPYWTDASILVNKARIPTCVFGPGDIQYAHSEDEQIRAKDVVTAARIYAQTALDYCVVN